MEYSYFLLHLSCTLHHNKLLRSNQSLNKKYKAIEIEYVGTQLGIQSRSRTSSTVPSETLNHSTLHTRGWPTKAEARAGGQSPAPAHIIISTSNKNEAKKPNPRLPKQATTEGPRGREREHGPSRSNAGRRGYQTNLIITPVGSAHGNKRT